MTFHTHRLSWGLILILLTAFLALKEDMTWFFPVSFQNSYQHEHTHTHTLGGISVLKCWIIQPWEALFQRISKKKINKLLQSSSLSRSSMSALKTVGLHYHALCNLPSNQILYVSWTIAANRFCFELKGFSPWILITYSQAESWNIKFLQTLFWA